jgi:hypothetical protein
MDNHTVVVEIEVDAVQEAIQTIRKINSKISWVLENNPPSNQKDLDTLQYRNANLTLVELRLTKALSDRALANQANGNVVKMGGKK